jgi:hypothetical protein
MKLIKFFQFLMLFLVKSPAVAEAGNSVSLVEVSWLRKNLTICMCPNGSPSAG